MQPANWSFFTKKVTTPKIKDAEKSNFSAKILFSVLEKKDPVPFKFLLCGQPSDNITKDLGVVPPFLL
jgi:hypothetical protein